MLRGGGGGGVGRERVLMGLFDSAINASLPGFHISRGLGTGTVPFPVFLRSHNDAVSMWVCVWELAHRNKRMQYSLPTETR